MPGNLETVLTGAFAAETGLLLLRSKNCSPVFAYGGGGSLIYALLPNEITPARCMCNHQYPTHDIPKINSRAPRTGR